MADNNGLLIIAIVLMMVLATSMGLFDDLFSLQRIEGQNKFSFDYSSSVVAGGRGLVKNASTLDGPRGVLSVVGFAPLKIGQFSFNLKSVGIGSEFCRETFLKEWHEFQAKFNISYFADWYPGDECLEPSVFVYGGKSVSLKKGGSVQINPCMTIAVVEQSYVERYKDPEDDKDEFYTKLVLSVDNLECMNISFKGLGKDDSLIYIVDNQLYPDIETFYDFKAVNKGLEAEQTTQVYNNPFVVLKEGVNEIVVPFDKSLFGDRELELLGGFYIRHGRDVVAVYDDSFIKSELEVDSAGVRITKQEVVEEQPVEIKEVVVEPSEQDVTTKSSGLALGVIGLVFVLATASILFFTKNGKKFIGRFKRK